jgi:hypothetical protein
VVEDFINVFLPEFTGNEVVTDPERNLFPGHLRFELADTGCNPFDPEQGLNPVGKIAGNRDLDIQTRVEPAGPGYFCYRYGAVQLVQQGLFISLHRGRELKHTGRILLTGIYHFGLWPAAGKREYPGTAAERSFVRCRNPAG